MSSILFLDDDPDRHFLVRQFEREVLLPKPPKTAPKHRQTYRLDQVWSASEAMDHIDRRLYDFAFLDFDLDAFVDFAPNGMTVVDYIITLPPFHRPKKVLVHSLNTGDAPGRMVERLKGHVREVSLAPFASPKMVDELSRAIHGS